MTRGCDRVREALVEHGGEVARLDEEARRHLAGCEACAAVAEGERRLAQGFGALQPSEDPELERLILARVRRIERRRRLAAALPLAAGLLLAALGAVLVGGLPAAGLLAALPSASLVGCIGLAARLADAAAAVRALAAVTPAWAAVAAAAVAAGLGAGLVRLVRRRLGGVRR